VPVTVEVERGDLIAHEIDALLVDRRGPTAGHSIAQRQRIREGRGSEAEKQQQAEHCEQHSPTVSDPAHGCKEGKVGGALRRSVAGTRRAASRRTRHFRLDGAARSSYDRETWRLWPRSRALGASVSGSFRSTFPMVGSKAAAHLAGWCWRTWCAP